MRNLSLENNLLSSWEQIVHLGTELPKLETLCLSYNKLELPENLSEMKEFRTLNDLDENITVDVGGVFPCVKTLVMIGMDMNWQKVKILAPFFPNLEELVLDENQCNDFEQIEETILTNFKNLRILNLNKNDITLTSLPNDTLDQDVENKMLIEENFTKNHSLENLQKFP